MLATLEKCRTESMSAALDGFLAVERHIDGISGDAGASQLSQADRWSIEPAGAGSMEHRAGVQEEFRFRDLSGEPGRALAVDGVFGAPDHGRDAGVPAAPWRPAPWPPAL